MTAAKKRNWVFIFGILLMCVGMQFANYGTAVTASAEVAAMGAVQYYIFISAMGTLGMMLVLPLLGKLIGIFGLRTMVIIGITIQTSARVAMMFCSNWLLYALCFLIQAIGGGCYLSSAYLNMAASVEPHERAKFFGFIAAANAVGAIAGPLIISNMYAMGGVMAKLTYIANLPLTLIGFLIIYRGCANTKKPSLAKGYDYTGLVAMVISIVGLVLWLCLSGKAFPRISILSAALAVVTVAAIVFTFRRELSIENPAVPLKMFKNKRLAYAFIGNVVNTSYSTCTGSYVVMWITMNYTASAMYTTFRGTGTIAQQIVVFLLGLFLGGYIAKKFALRFRFFGVFGMFMAMVACGTLYCLKFTGTAAEGNIVWLTESFPLGMLLIYFATALGGVTSAIAQSTFSAFWQSNTPREELSSGQALYDFAATGGSCLFSAVCGAILGTSVDYSRAFATGFAFCVIGVICALKGFVFTKEEIAAAKAAPTK